MTMKARKAVHLFLVIILCITLGGCAASEKEMDSAKETSLAESEEAAATTGYSQIDYDLSGFNGMMTYSQIYNMSVSSASYEGKVVRLNGAISRRTENGQEIYSVTTYDEEGCCTQKIDLALIEGQSPVAGKQMTVTGTFAPGIAASVSSCRLLEAIVEP